MHTVTISDSGNHPHTRTIRGRVHRQTRIPRPLQRRHHIRRPLPQVNDRRLRPLAAHLVPATPAEHLDLETRVGQLVLQRPDLLLRRDHPVGRVGPRPRRRVIRVHPLWGHELREQHPLRLPSEGGGADLRQFLALRVLQLIDRARGVVRLRVLRRQLDRSHSIKLTRIQVVRLIQQQKINLVETTPEVIRPRRKLHLPPGLDLHLSLTRRRRVTHQAACRPRPRLDPLPQPVADRLRRLPLMRRENDLVIQYKHPVQDDDLEDQRLTVLPRADQHNIRVQPMAVLISGESQHHLFALPRHRGDPETLRQLQRLLTVGEVTVAATHQVLRLLPALKLGKLPVDDLPEPRVVIVRGQRVGRLLLQRLGHPASFESPPTTAGKPSSTAAAQTPPYPTSGQPRPPR